MERTGDSEKVYLEALEIRRKLAVTNPTVYLGDLTETFMALEGLYLAEQKQAEGEQILKEMVSTYRNFAADNHEYAPGVAMALADLGMLYVKANKWQESEGAFQEALKIYRQAAAEDDPGYQASVVYVLSELGKIYELTNRQTEATAARSQAAEIKRQFDLQEDALPQKAGYTKP
jgi:tetratricopeptide (TPR) repeat protein